MSNWKQVLAVVGSVLMVGLTMWVVSVDRSSKSDITITEIGFWSEDENYENYETYLHNISIEKDKEYYLGFNGFIYKVIGKIKVIDLEEEIFISEEYIISKDGSILKLLSKGNDAKDSGGESE